MENPCVTANVVCIGAGPAGITAGYLLSKAGAQVTVIERDSIYVGGISKTVNYKGFLFDIGGHRFFSKSEKVKDLWTEILGNEFLKRPRKSRIYYGGKLFSYPLKAFEALWKLGILEAARCVLSYGYARLHPINNPKNFEEWVTNQFGKRLFSIFFKTYTEKVWGMKCTEISADWAAQRIKGLSLATAVWHAIIPQRRPKDRGAVIKTLIDTFQYPRRGPGMMWETAARKIEANGGSVLMGHDVIGASYDDACLKWTITTRDAAHAVTKHQADHVISSTSLKELFAALFPPPSASALAAAQSLRYRDFLIVVLIIKDRNVFDDNWIYIHDPRVKVGRIDNFKSWSPELVPDPALNSYGLEYFCFENDEIWSTPDDKLIALAKTELVLLGLAKTEDIVDGHVVRQPKAYPIYDDHYKEHVKVLRDEVQSCYPNLHVVGRNGMHKYNNQDHTMMTAMLTVQNILLGYPRYDVWQVNQDAEYHEAGAVDATTKP